MHKKACMDLNYFWYFLVSVSALVECVAAYAYASLIVVPLDIAISAVVLKICALAAGSKKYKSIIKRRKEALKP